VSPELTGFLLGLLLGAAKLMAIGILGFGIAWWRGRARIRALEAELLELGPSSGADTERWRAIEQRMNDMARQLEQLSETHRLLAERILPPPQDRSPRP
jgi:hypothetical protein